MGLVASRVTNHNTTSLETKQNPERAYPRTDPPPRPPLVCRKTLVFKAFHEFQTANSIIEKNAETKENGQGDEVTIV